MCIVFKNDIIKLFAIRLLCIFQAQMFFYFKDRFFIVKGVIVNIKFKESAKIVGYYTSASFLWILFSDKVLYLVVKDIKHYTAIQTYKGSFFIILTAALLFKLIFGSYSKLETLNNQLKRTLTDLENNQRELEKLAYVDHLTGLATRRLLDEKYKLLFESAKRSQNTLTLLMIDIDYFKRYNDRYGHQEGDRILKIMGDLLKDIFRREGDVISRYGGEEFSVVLYQTSLEDTIHLVETFREKLKLSNIEHKDSPFGQITVSIGINSGCVSRDQSSYDFFRKVDRALYKAKEGGRNRYCF